MCIILRKSRKKLIVEHVHFADLHCRVPVHFVLILPSWHSNLCSWWNFQSFPAPAPRYPVVLIVKRTKPRSPIQPTGDYTCLQIRTPDTRHVAQGSPWKVLGYVRGAGGWWKPPFPLPKTGRQGEPGGWAMSPRGDVRDGRRHWTSFSAAHISPVTSMEKARD